MTWNLSEPPVVLSLSGSEGDSLLSKVNLTLRPSPYFLLSLLETQFLFLSELFASSTNILQSPNFKRSSLECLKSLCCFLTFPFPLNFLKVCLYLVSAFFLLHLLLTFYLLFFQSWSFLITLKHLIFQSTFSYSNTLSNGSILIFLLF